MKSVLDGAQMEKFQESIKNLEVSDSLLRDWFAGQVLSTLSRNTAVHAASDAVLAYDWADAMMEERAKRKKERGK